MRWLIVVPFVRPELMGMDFRDELVAMGHEVRTFAYRRDNVLYKNRSTKAGYEIWILRQLEALCRQWRPSLVLVFKGGPITPGLIRRVKASTDALFLNLFPDNPLWMIPFERIEPYDIFFTKERYALRALEGVGLRNLYYLPHHSVPDYHHPVTLTAEETTRFASPVSFVGSCYPYRERLMRELSSYPLRLWGSGWDRAGSPGVRALAAGGPVWGRAKLAVYSGSTVSLNHHHPMNDIVGRQQPGLRARGERRLPDRGAQGGAAGAVHARRRGGDLPRPRRAAPSARLLPGAPGRGARHRRERPAAARSRSTPCATASRRSSR